MRNIHHIAEHKSKLTTNNAVYITCFSFLFLDLLEPVYAFKEKPKASYAAQGTKLQIRLKINP